jgi:hypothetical protein
MKTKLFLRIAAIMIMVHLLGHTVGHFTWDKPDDTQMKRVVNSMLEYKAEFMGATRSMGDYFNGYSLMMFFVFGMSISILWYASNFPDNQKAITRKILYPIGIAYVAFGVIEFYNFFPFAAIMSLGAGVLILIAVYGRKEIE